MRVTSGSHTALQGVGKALDIFRMTEGEQNGQVLGKYAGWGAGDVLRRRLEKLRSIDEASAKCGAEWYPDADFCKRLEGKAGKSDGCA